MRNLRALGPALTASITLVAAAALLAVPDAASAAPADRGGDRGGDRGSGAAGDSGRSTTDRLQAAGLASTIALDNCSGSLVRFDSSQPGDKALLLTNGHCYEHGLLDGGEVLVDAASSRRGTLLSASGAALGTVRAERLLYATMTGTDAALYRLDRTYAQIQATYGATALTVSDTRPADGSAISIPSSYWKRTYTCAVDGFVPTLREGSWTWRDSIRYAHPDESCETIGGTSGSPIVDDATLEVVGVNNTTNEDGATCSLNNPCEVGPDGSTSVEQGQNYGQQTYWFTTCLGTGNSLDLTRSGCLLTQP